MQKQYWRVYGTDGKAYYVWAENSYDAQLSFSKVYPNLGVSGAIVAWGPTPGANAPTIGGPTTPTMVPSPVDEGPIQAEGDPSLEMIDPSAAYLQHLGRLGFDVASATPGLRQQAAERQQQPLFDLFRGRQLAKGNVLGDVSPEEYEQQWQGFLGLQPRQGGQDPANYFPGATSQDLMSQFGQVETQGQGALTARQRSMYDPREGASYGGPISGLGISALQQSMSPLMPGMGAVPSETDLWRRWRATRGEGAVPEDQAFTDYVRSQLGLSAFA